jgi:hypothetical protein
LDQRLANHAMQGDTGVTCSLAASLVDKHITVKLERLSAQNVLKDQQLMGHSVINAIRVFTQRTKLTTVPIAFPDRHHQVA